MAPLSLMLLPSGLRFHSSFGLEAVPLLLLLNPPRVVMLLSSAFGPSYLLRWLIPSLPVRPLVLLPVWLMPRVQLPLPVVPGALPLPPPWRLFCLYLLGGGPVGCRFCRCHLFSDLPLGLLFQVLL